MMNRNRKCDEEFAHLLGIWCLGVCGTWVSEGFTKRVELDINNHSIED